MLGSTAEDVGGQHRQQRRGRGDCADLRRPVPTQRRRRRQPDGAEKDQHMGTGGICRKRRLGDHAGEQGGRFRRIASLRRHSQQPEVGYERRGNKQSSGEEEICATASKDAPWFVVPARLVVAAAIVGAVEQLDLGYPKVTQDQRKELTAARAELIAEK